MLGVDAPNTAAICDTLEKLLAQTVRSTLQVRRLVQAAVAAVVLR